MTDERSEAARKLSRAGASKGGRARASVLTPEERREIARRAVTARWEKAGKRVTPVQPDPPKQPKDVPDATPFSMFRGTLHLGEVELECHVLNDGRRVLTQREVVRVLTGGTNNSNLPRYFDTIESFADFRPEPIPFKVPPLPQIAFGYEATLLVEICSRYLEARERGQLKVPTQLRRAQTAEVILRACAKVGIIALIDEATGYQAFRAKNALQIKLQAFIAEDMQEWVKMFPDEFWFELARLEGIHYSPRHRPLRWGKYVMAFVYDAVDQDVGKELRARNPNPHHRQNHHQWLTHGFGREKVRDHLQRVIAVMKLCDDMADFDRKFGHVFRKQPLQLAFDPQWLGE